MATRALSTNEFELSQLLDNYSLTYLRQYWPEVPAEPIAWADNAVLMLAYQDAALAAQRFIGKNKCRLLDISTGPALAPLLGAISCIDEVQLSDFVEDNRRCLQAMPVDYWRNYIPMLIRLFRNPREHTEEILLKLDHLRSQFPPLTVDLLHDGPVVPSTVDPFSFDMVSMNFVADSITNNLPDYLRCLGRVTDMVRPGAAFMMSATVDCQGWQLGNLELPSPNVPEETILDFLASQGMELLHLSRSMRQYGQTYSGGWIVLSAAKLR